MIAPLSRGAIGDNLVGKRARHAGRRNGVPPGVHAVENLMASNPPHALRLTFAYEGAQIRLAGSERIAMIVPAPVSAPPEAGQTGYWFGVQDAGGRLLYHQPLHRPIKVDVEVFSPEGRQSIARVPTSQRTGRFTVLMPDVADAHTFALHGPPDPDRPDEPARELLRLGVDALRRSKPPPGAGGTPPPQGQKG